MPTGMYKHKPLSDEHKRAISLGNTGKTQTAEHNAAISKSMTGKKYSKERRSAISLGHIKSAGNTHRDRKLRKQYGITEEQYDAMVAKQNGVCKMCGKPETVSIRGTTCRLSVDHDHVTGKVRDLLCSACNRQLGFYEKHKSKFEKYLEAHK